MTHDEFAAELLAGGVVPRMMNPASGYQYTVFGDRIAHEEIDCYKWASAVTHSNGQWIVALPPLPCPGPGPEFKVPTLNAAASLLLFAFTHRSTATDASPREEVAFTNRIYEEWIRLHPQHS